MSGSIGLRLEKYTLQQKQEVLMVNLETAAGEPDIVMIYAGFSSSLMRRTSFDPDVLVIANDSIITSIDRLASPYNPAQPKYIASGMTRLAMEKILQQMKL